MSLPLSGYRDREQTDTEAEVSAEGRTLDPTLLLEASGCSSPHPPHPPSAQRPWLRWTSITANPCLGPPSEGALDGHHTMCPALQRGRGRRGRLAQP